MQETVERVRNPEGGTCRRKASLRESSGRKAADERGCPLLSSAVGDRNPRRGAPAKAWLVPLTDGSFEEEDNPQRGELAGSRWRATSERESPQGPAGNGKDRTGWVEPMRPYRTDAATSERESNLEEAKNAAREPRLHRPATRTSEGAHRI